MHNTLFRTALLAAALGSFSHTASAEGVMVHLFQWKFNDIANECETVLRPKGFGGVQITPPAEHKQGSQVWWTVYQPVSFKNFNSFGGSEAELRSMIARCNAAGVNSMPTPSSTSWHRVPAPPPAAAATTRGNTNIPSSATTTSTTAATSPTTATATTSGTAPSTACRTSIPAHPYVQDQIATYMKTLLGWGVAGFRIDAAAHGAGRCEGHPRQGGQPQGLPGGDRRRRGVPDIQPGRYTYIDTVTDFKYGTDPPPTSTARSRTSRPWRELGPAPPTRPSSSWSTTTANAATAVAACSPS